MEFFIPILLSLISGLSTALGGLVVFLIKKPKLSYLSISFGFSAGVMIFLSFSEILNQGISMVGFLCATTSFFLGILVFYLIDVLIPHIYEEESYEGKRHSLKRIAMLLFLGVIIHNLPEGMAVSFSAASNIDLGLIVALAIIIHNIPEGVSISMPIFYLTRKRSKAFLYSLVSGLAEPLGAVLSLAVFSSFLNEFVLGVLLSASAGIMIFISFDELLPYAYKQKNQHQSIMGMFLGMFVIAVSIFIFS